MKLRIIKLVVLFLLLIIPQIGTSNAYYFDQATISGITVTAGCWSSPSKPTLIYPSNGYVANIGSDWLANPYMDWSDSWVCPDKTVSYQYESYYDSNLTNLAYRSIPLLNNSTIPAPGTSDGNYYWRVRAYDGEKWSDWSDVWLLTVDRTPAPVPTSFQAVVINEIMWMGSSLHINDEWIELRNTTSTTINLSGWYLTGAGAEASVVYLAGSIGPNGYYLVSNFDPNRPQSALKNSIVLDQPAANLSFLDTGETIALYNSSNVVIDQTPLGSWAEGVNGPPDWKSMERNNIPGDGTLAGSWHTCETASCHSTTFWDVDGHNWGTPKAANLSENDSSILETNLDFYISSDKRVVGFKVYGSAVSQFDSLDYLVTYDSNQGQQVIKGTKSIQGNSEIEVNNLLLGSCSSGTCVYHSGVTKVKLEVVLKGIIERILTKEISL